MVIPWFTLDRKVWSSQVWLGPSLHGSGTIVYMNKLLRNAAGMWMYQCVHVLYTRMYMLLRRHRKQLAMSMQDNPNVACLSCNEVTYQSRDAI